MRKPALEEILVWGALLLFLGLTFLLAIPRDEPLPPQGPPLSSPTAPSETPNDPIPESPEPITHELSWKDFQGRAHRGTLAVEEHHYHLAVANRLHLGKDPETGESFWDFQRRNPYHYRNDYYSFYWLWVYRNLVRHDERFEELYEFSRPFVEKLVATDAADAIVCAVQNIPYTLIHKEQCNAILNEDPDCASYHCKYHENDFENDTANGRPCLPETLYGLLSPGEFAHKLIGDCDTRVVFLFTLLKRHGFDVAILSSKAFGHCILGISLPSRGFFKEYRGKRYYTWETVARDWMRGQLYPPQQNMDKWTVIMTS